MEVYVFHLDGIEKLCLCAVKAYDGAGEFEQNPCIYPSVLQENKNDCKQRYGIGGLMIKSYTCNVINIHHLHPPSIAKNNL
jgi:hypothetical protein